MDFAGSNGEAGQIEFGLVMCGIHEGGVVRIRNANRACGLSLFDNGGCHGAKVSSVAAVSNSKGFGRKDWQEDLQLQ